MKLSIILRYLFQDYGKSISSEKVIQEQRQCSLLNICGCLDSQRPMTFLQKMRGISEMHLSVQTIRTTEYLEVFLRNLLLNEKNELHNRNLHISGLWNGKKVDIGEEKVDIQDVKVDIERVLSEKCNDFSVRTTIHIHRLFEKFGFEEVFGRSAVMELLELKSSGASKLLSNLVQADIIEPVSGHGKGKYKFKK